MRRPLAAGASAGLVVVGGIVGGVVGVGVGGGGVAAAGGPKIGIEKILRLAAGGRLTSAASATESGTSETGPGRLVVVRPAGRAVELLGPASSMWSLMLAPTPSAARPAPGSATSVMLGSRLVVVLSLEFGRPPDGALVEEAGHFGGPAALLAPAAVVFVSPGPFA